MAATTMRDPNRYSYAVWKTEQGFVCPAWADPFVSRAESAPEAYFARAVVQQPGADVTEQARAVIGSIAIEAQAPAGLYRVDFLIEFRAGDRRYQLAAEIDGYGFDHMKREQVERDYARERQLVGLGIPVIRFTAAEVLRHPEQCWSETRHIIEVIARANG